MKTQNRLGKVLFDLLIIRKLTSMTISEARDLLLSDYKDSYNSKTLYKHLSQQLHRLKEHGLVILSPDKHSNFLRFEVTKKFRPQDFISSNTTKIFDSDSSEQSKEQGSLLALLVKKKIQELDDDISCLTAQKKEFEKILNANPTYAAIADKFLERNVDSVKEFLIDTLGSKNFKLFDK